MSRSNFGRYQLNRIRFTSLILTSIFVDAGLAQTARSAPDIAWRVEHLAEDHVISADGTEAATFTFASKILKESALENLKQASVTYSKSAQSLEVIEAYTRKSDGRHINVPKSNYQVRSDAGQGGNSPAFSDYNQTSVVFPEVAVGDTVVMSYRIVTKQPWFPGKISIIGTFPRSVPYDDVRITIDAPANMAATYAVHGMSEKATVAGGRKRLQWTLQNKEPVKNERVDYSVYDIEAEPGYLYSTFSSYTEVARSYVDRANAKAVVTPRIRELAGEITKGKTTPAEQTRSLYEWVASNITYAGNCVGLGAVVPRDLDVVLDNKMGDCKDHATLLQALLAAKDIESHQALVNANNIYRLPTVPIASLVNHVINYVPSLKLFLDSTDSNMPFGLLAVSVQDKPVLMDVSGAPQRTPPNQLGSNRQFMKTMLTIHDDGSADGHVAVKEAGAFGVAARRRFKTLSSDDESAAVTRYFRSVGLEGEGRIVRGDDHTLTDRYEYEASFKIKNMIPYPGSGAFYVSPLFYSEAPVARFAQQAMMPFGDVDGACTSAISEEEFDITLPEKMSVLALPDPIAFNSPLVSFESSYSMDGRVLKIRRKLDDRSPANVCSAQTLKEYKAALEPVWKNLRQQVLYK